MQLQVRFRGASREEFGQHEYEEVLLSSLERFRHRIEQVSLYVEDVNGPRGGIDKECRCVLHLRRRPPVVITDRDNSMTALLYRVANRAAYTLSQENDRSNKRMLRNRSQRRSFPISDPSWNVSRGA